MNWAAEQIGDARITMSLMPAMHPGRGIGKDWDVGLITTQWGAARGHGHDSWKVDEIGEEDSNPCGNPGSYAGLHNTIVGDAEFWSQRSCEGS